MPICEQMAHIGSEVHRAINWRKKDKKDLSQNAMNRALELIDLSLTHAKTISHRKEISRLREALVDYFLGENEFCSTDTLWQRYFDHFNYFVRRNY